MSCCYSSKLDPAAAGLPRCVRAVAAAEKAVAASRDTVRYSNLPYSYHMLSMLCFWNKKLICYYQMV